MIVQIVVAALLSLAVSPVLQADSLDDFCESLRLEDLAYERWAEDLPESNRNWESVELHRKVMGMNDLHCGANGLVHASSYVKRVLWLSDKTAASNLMMLESHMKQLESFADARSGLDRLKQSGRFMSVETLLLFAEAKIYATRAFLGAAATVRERELESAREAGVSLP